MSVHLSIELLITGTVTDIKKFWATLNPKDEPLSERHFLKLLNRPVSDDEEYFDGYEVHWGDSGQQLSITWSGGFGGFDQGYLGITFRDDGIVLSELFPTLEFTLYYDAHGEEFAGGYGSERCAHGTETTSESVYAGGVRYRAGVRIGEKTLIEDEYFLQENGSDDDEEEFSTLEPDYHNNRQKIDEAIEKAKLRPSTLYYRKKWEKKWLSNNWVVLEDFILSREFWREVPLINTETTYIDKKVSLAAINQSICAIIFLPADRITPEILDRAKKAKGLSALFSHEESERRQAILTIGLGLLLLIGLQPSVYELIRKDPNKFPVSEQKDQKNGLVDFDQAYYPDEFATVDRALKYLMSNDPESGSLLQSFKNSLLSGDDKTSREGLVRTIRFLCSKRFDEAEE
jgi:hypothetical protein